MTDPSAITFRCGTDPRHEHRSERHARLCEAQDRAAKAEARWSRLRTLVREAAPLTAMDGATLEQRGKAEALAVVMRAMDEIEAAAGFVGGGK